MTKNDPEMTASDVLAFVKLLEAHSVWVCIDGGWGVDALLGEQTRPHADLDIALEHKDVPLVRVLLEERGYSNVPRDDTRDCNFVLGDEEGHQVDFHSFTFDENGSIVFGVAYPFDSLRGSGTINDGSASFFTSWTPIAAGTYYWRGVYAGDGNNNGFTDLGGVTEQIVINSTTPTLLTTPGPGG